MEDQTKATGEVCIEIRDKDGNLKDKREIKNLVVTVGKEKMAERAFLAAPATEGPKYMGVGKSSTAAAAGDTELHEQDGARKEVTTRKVEGKVGTFAVTFGEGEHTTTLKECGLFSTASAGSLYARAVFTEVVKGAEDTLTITWKITLE